MSDLKHQSLDQLKQSERECKEYIARLKSQLSGKEERLKWIKRYIFERTPQELSWAEIEQRLGHKVIVK